VPQSRFAREEKGVVEGLEIAFGDFLLRCKKKMSKMSENPNERLDEEQTEW
jgi:hypothetical protein